MSALALALGLTLALAADGGVPDVSDALDGGADGGNVPAPFSHRIYGACPVTSEAAVPADGPDGGSGWFLPGQRGPRLACLLAACEEYRAQNEGERPPALNVPLVTTVAVVVAAAVGVAAGFALGFTFRK